MTMRDGGMEGWNFDRFNVKLGELRGSNDKHCRRLPTDTFFQAKTNFTDDEMASKI